MGETLKADRRLAQHMQSEAKKDLTETRVVLHEKYNKSAALGLESFLMSRDSRISLQADRWCPCGRTRYLPVRGHLISRACQVRATTPRP
ncbi:hypothetical protein, partial [Citricoccus zhacaiensis]|uniref:hypothetical protein n=1 Tax=Citricoccus zhacaiensis TaxID=489142 RepID=UPI003CF75B5F